METVDKLPDPNGPMYIVIMKLERKTFLIEELASPLFFSKKTAMEWQMASGRRGEYEVVEI